MIKLRPLHAMRLAVALGCVLGTGLVVAQSTDGTGDSAYRLRGSVVNGTTGKPLARALVMSQDRRLAAMSDSAGNFSIDVKVPPRPGDSTSSSVMPNPLVRRFLRLYLTAQKPGYVLQGDAVMVAPDDTASSSSLKLVMMPTAMISGRVSAVGTDSAANVLTTLLMKQVTQDGRRRWVQTGGMVTDARGEFHFSDLRPGEYSLMTGVWRGDQPAPERKATVTQEYPPTFYGDRPDLDTAEKIHLHYGDNVRTEIHLHETTCYAVTLPVTRPPGSGGVNVSMLEVSHLSGHQLRFLSSTGAVEGWLPNGHYNLLLTSTVPGQGPGQVQQSYGLVSVNVEGAPVTAAAVALGASAPIVVRVHADAVQQPDPALQVNGRPMGGGPLAQVQSAAQSLQLFLEPEYETRMYMAVQDPSAGSDELVVKDVPPGKYFVRAQSFQGYVAVMSSGVTDLLQQPLVVAAGGGVDAIDVNIREDNPKLTGAVNVGSEVMLLPAYVLLLPTDASGQFVQTMTDLHGEFRVNSLTPGSYRVLAFRHRPPQLAYRDPETLARFDGKGSTISVAPGQTLQTQVDLLDDSVLEEN